MGQATILSGGTDGRYLIELDFGEQYRLAVIAALTSLLAQIDADIAAEEARRDAAAADEAAAQAQLNQAIADQIAAVQAQGAIDNKALQFVRAFFLRAQAERARLDSLLQALRFDRASTARRITTWQNFQPLSQRQAWCADFTENGGGQVATLEINGEPGLIVIAPGARVPLQSDGGVRAREVLSGPQAYLNAALLPGWQRHLPTYRWGTIHDIDIDTNRCRVNLASATSSAQNLPINAVSVLTNVPVVYMNCNAAAFEEADRVVVEFQGRDWAQPRVIGFLDNPRPCEFLTAEYIIDFALPLRWPDGSNRLTLQTTRGRDWDEVTAPETATYAFLAWTDGGGAFLSLNRTIQDANAQANVTRRVTYMYTSPIYATIGGGSNTTVILSVVPTIDDGGALVYIVTVQTTWRIIFRNYNFDLEISGNWVPAPGAQVTATRTETVVAAPGDLGPPFIAPYPGGLTFPSTHTAVLLNADPLPDYNVSYVRTGNDSFGQPIYTVASVTRA